ncbi:MAG: hypothetical protein PHT88_05700 [Candidatus Moranbacteria bacterium]|nr:hypothetical protein [Candidatus Moranbacteria bacterium]
MKKFIAGPIIGIISALVMAWLLISLTNQENNIGDLYLILLETAVVLVPLLLANIVLTFVYFRRNVPRLTYAWMWIPLLAVWVVQMMFNYIQLQQKRAIEAAHPNIQEVHVNLSGRSLWLDPEESTDSADGMAEMPGNDPSKFITFTRYYGNDYGKEDNMTAYNVARLADSFNEMHLFYGKPESTQPTFVPVKRPTAFPNVKTFIDLLSFKGGEASVIRYWYYHYSDHVDVVPAISLSGSQSMDLWGTGVPLVDFHIANLGTLPIARLEIDGQSIDLGSEAFYPENENSICTSRNFQAYAINHLNAPIKVRWQLAQANPAWHETSVVVPKFSAGHAPIVHIRSTSVDLYFQSDGSVIAERSQFGELSQEQYAIRTTGPAVPLLHKPPCGLAPDRYTENVKVIRN